MLDVPTMAGASRPGAVQEGRVGERCASALGQEWGDREQEEAERAQRHREGQETFRIHDSVPDEGGAGASKVELGRGGGQWNSGNQAPTSSLQARPFSTRDHRP